VEEEAEGEGISSIIIPEHPSENVTSIIQLMLLIQFSKLMILGHPRNLFPLCCREMVPDFTFLQISVIPGVRMSPHQDIYKTINSMFPNQQVSYATPSTFVQPHINPRFASTFGFQLPSNAHLQTAVSIPQSYVSAEQWSNPALEPSEPEVKNEPEL